MGAIATGVLALGAFAIGALAIARFSIGRLKIAAGSVHDFEIDDLTVRRLQILESDELADRFDHEIQPT